MSEPHEQTGTLGDPRVDEAVARLDDLEQRPVGEHVEVFEDVHGRLQAALQEAAYRPEPSDGRPPERP
jgi:hypothetical protein